MQAVTRIREPISKRIMRNTAYNAVGRLWLIGTNLLLAPLLLSYLGQDRFGVWVLFWSLIQYCLLLDLGVGASLVKYFSEFEAKGDVRSVNRVLASTITVYIVVGVALVLLLWPLVAWLSSFFSIPQDLRQEATVTFQLGLVAFFLINLVSIFDGLLKGFQRMDLVNLTLIAVSIPNLLGSYLVLRLGWGLLGLVMVVVIVYVLQLFLFVLQARSVCPSLTCHRRDVRFETLRLLFGYGARLQIARLANLVSYQTDKILLGLFVPLRYVTFYDLGSKVSYVTHELPHVMLGALLPAASELSGNADHTRLWTMYERGTKYLFLFSIPALIGIWLTAHLVLQAWLGHVSSDVHLAVVLLSTGYWAVVSVGMVTTVGAGIGWVGPLMRTSLIQGGLNLLLSLALIIPFGYVGVLVGTTTALILSNGYLLALFCRDFNRPLRDHARLAGRIFLLNIPPVIVSLPAVLLLSGWVKGGGRGVAFVALLGCVILYGIVYLATIRMAGLLDRGDRDLLGDYLPLVHALIRKSG